MFIISISIHSELKPKLVARMVLYGIVNHLFEGRNLWLVWIGVREQLELGED